MTVRGITVTVVVEGAFEAAGPEMAYAARAGAVDAQHFAEVLVAAKALAARTTNSVRAEVMPDRPPELSAEDMRRFRIREAVAAGRSPLSSDLQLVGGGQGAQVLRDGSVMLAGAGGYGEVIARP